jgi:protein-disulfide isomerase
MNLNRRTLVVALAGSPLLAGLARAADATPDVNGRSVGRANAPLTVSEYYSLTCPHCAAFARETFPQIKTNLVDTGKIRWVFREFPLDRLALMASQVALSLPPEQYENFIMVLFNNQDRWAFAQGINYTEELSKFAALAGMSRSAYDAAVNNTALQNAILAEQQQSVDKFKIDSTPTFICNEKRRAGEMSYDDFAKWVGVSSS